MAVEMRNGHKPVSRQCETGDIAYVMRVNMHEEVKSEADTYH